MLPPRKLTWNLKMMVSKFRISSSRGSFSGSMLVFRGVYMGFLVCFGSGGSWSDGLPPPLVSFHERVSSEFTALENWMEKTMAIFLVPRF